MPGLTLRHFCVHTYPLSHMEPHRGSLFSPSLPQRGAHAPRRGLTHVWPPANHTKDTPTPYTSPLPTSAGGTPGTLGRRPYTCITPTWTSAKCARSRWGQQSLQANTSQRLHVRHDFLCDKNRASATAARTIKEPCTRVNVAHISHTCS